VWPPVITNLISQADQMLLDFKLTLSAERVMGKKSDKKLYKIRWKGYRSAVEHIGCAPSQDFSLRTYFYHSKLEDTWELSKVVGAKVFLLFSSICCHTSRHPRALNSLDGIIA
jgi:hypothetical protein